MWSPAKPAPGALFQQQPVSSTGWTVQRATLASNQVRGPDGKTSASVLTEDGTSSNSHRMFREVTASLTAVPYRYSIYAKNLVGSRNIQLLHNDSGFGSFIGPIVNPATGAIVVDSGTNSVKKLRNGWWRFDHVYTGTIDTSRWLYVQMMDGASDSYNGDGVSAVAVWGVDFRLG
jgi:hypothetical protein